ncbi:hypothetical protein BD770DRAFT_405817 [Pilaira anomala]|nr:hypothetical protein BD770DRAFT_405817 [Pilaira anomala]
MLVQKLPIEIIQDIAYYLPNRDITTCQIICKKWYKKFISITYYCVRIKGAMQFKKFFDHTLKNSIYPGGSDYAVGTQIRKLIVENGHIEPFILGQLPQLCPYLQVFMFDGIVLSHEARKEPFQHYQQRRNKEELEKIKSNFIHWKYMRRFVEYNGIHATHAMLGISSQLTHISVQFSNPNDKTNSKLSFIKSLINAPLLKSLSIERIYLSVTELELIHRNAPNLHYLSLLNTVFTPIPPEFLLQKVELAKHLYDVHFVDGNFSDDILQWLKYISQKYINVKTLGLGSCSFIPQDDKSTEVFDKKTYQDQLMQIATRFTRLKILRVSSFVLGHKFFDLLDRNGKGLKELTLGNGLSPIQLEKELTHLMHSRQRHTLDSLSLNGGLLILAKPTGFLPIMNTIRKCSNLTILHLSMGRYSNRNSVRPENRMEDYGILYFDYILELCPKLTTLSVSDAKLITTCDTNYYNKLNRVSYLLQSLTLSNILFDSSNVFDMIRSQCPSLNQLLLTATIIKGSDDLNTRHFGIYLPNHRLDTLVLDRIRISNKCSIRLGTSRFKIINATETVWYDLIGYECCTSIFPVAGNNLLASTTDNGGTLQRMRARKVKVTTHSEAHPGVNNNLDQGVYVTVQCKSVRSIYLTGLQVE